MRQEKRDRKIEEAKAEVGRVFAEAASQSLMAGNNEPESHISSQQYTQIGCIVARAVELALKKVL